eukprot:439972-Prorocentrum_lima.AAC.1
MAAARLDARRVPSPGLRPNDQDHPQRQDLQATATVQGHPNGITRKRAPLGHSLRPPHRLLRARGRSGRAH